MSLSRLFLRILCILNIEGLGYGLLNFVFYNRGTLFGALIEAHRGVVTPVECGKYHNGKHYDGEYPA